VLSKDIDFDHFLSIPMVLIHVHDEPCWRRPRVNVQCSGTDKGNMNSVVNAVVNAMNNSRGTMNDE
jgi:hypothetical protein